MTPPTTTPTTVLRAEPALDPSIGEPVGHGPNRGSNGNGLYHAEDLHLLERLVVAGRVGAFTPSADGRATGDRLTRGDVVGTIGDEASRSPFTGTIAGWLAQPGEQVRVGQPLLWLRADA